SYVLVSHKALEQFTTASNSEARCQISIIGKRLIVAGRHRAGDDKDRLWYRNKSLDRQIKIFLITDIAEREKNSLILRNSPAGPNFHGTIRQSPDFIHANWDLDNRYSGRNGRGFRKLIVGENKIKREIRKPNRKPMPPSRANYITTNRIMKISSIADPPYFRQKPMGPNPQRRKIFHIGIEKHQVWPMLENFSGKYHATVNNSTCDRKLCNDSGQSLRKRRREAYLLFKICPATRQERRRYK